MLGLWLAGIPGCIAPEVQLHNQLHDPAPEKRIRAVVQVARAQRLDLAPQLVELLEDEDPAVRLYAILALERFYGTRLDYSYSAPADRRRAGAQRWRVYLANSPPESRVSDAVE